jgi:hypothetical protein
MHMKWLKSTFALAALVGATAVSGSAFAHHGYWRHHHHGPRADISLGFTIGDPWYAPAPRYYYEPVPRAYYQPAPRYYYDYAYAPSGYYYYPYPSAVPYDNSRD